MRQLRSGAFLVVLVVLLSACGGNGHPSASPSHSPTPTSSASPGATPRAEPAMLGGGKVSMGTDVPWSKVGAGWYLSLISQGKTGPNGEMLARAVLLDLVDPLGGRYQMLKVRTSPQRVAPELESWSGDGRTALLLTGSQTAQVQAVRVDLTTSTTTALPLPKDVSSVALLPDGSGVLAQRSPMNLTPSAQGQIVRIGWDGTSTTVWPHATASILLAPDGAHILTAGKTYRDTTMTVLSADGSQQREIELARSCRPIRWWSTDTALITCSEDEGLVSRLMLLPIDAGKATKLTPPRDGNHGPDLGDLDARKLGDRLFLQAAGPCGYEFVAEQPASGNAVQVTVPHARGNVHLLGTHGNALVLQAGLSCDGGAVRSAFLELDPATGKERVLDTLPADEQFTTMLAYVEIRATQPG